MIRIFNIIAFRLPQKFKLDFPYNNLTELFGICEKEIPKLLFFQNIFVEMAKRKVFSTIFLHKFSSVPALVFFFLEDFTNWSCSNNFLWQRITVVNSAPRPQGRKFWLQSLTIPNAKEERKNYASPMAQARKISVLIILSKNVGPTLFSLICR